MTDIPIFQAHQSVSQSVSQSGTGVVIRPQSGALIIDPAEKTLSVANGSLEQRAVRRRRRSQIVFSSRCACATYLPLNRDCIVALVESPPLPPPPFRIVKPAAAKTKISKGKVLLGSHFIHRNTTNGGHKQRPSARPSVGPSFVPRERARAATSTSRQDDDRSATEALVTTTRRARARR